MDNLVAEGKEDGIVGDDEGGAAILVTGTEEGEGHTLGAVLVEGRGGFIKKEEGLGQGEGGGQEETLPLSTRKFGGLQV